MLANFRYIHKNELCKIKGMPIVESTLLLLTAVQFQFLKGFLIFPSACKVVAFPTEKSHRNWLISVALKQD